MNHPIATRSGSVFVLDRPSLDFAARSTWSDVVHSVMLGLRRRWRNEGAPARGYAEVRFWGDVAPLASVEVLVGDTAEAVAAKLMRVLREVGA